MQIAPNTLANFEVILQMKKKLTAVLLLFVLTLGQSLVSVSIVADNSQEHFSRADSHKEDVIPAYLPSSGSLENASFSKTWLADFTFAEFPAFLPFGNPAGFSVSFADQHFGWRSMAVVLLYPAHEFS